MGTTFEGLQSCTLKIMEGKKTSKIRRDFGQLQILIANISGMHNAIDKLKTPLSTAISPTFDKKW